MAHPSPGGLGFLPGRDLFSPREGLAASPGGIGCLPGRDLLPPGEGSRIIPQPAFGLGVMPGVSKLRTTNPKGGLVDGISLRSKCIETGHPFHFKLGKRADEEAGGQGAGAHSA